MQDMQNKEIEVMHARKYDGSDNEAMDSNDSLGNHVGITTMTNGDGKLGTFWLKMLIFMSKTLMQFMLVLSSIIAPSISNTMRKVMNVISLQHNSLPLSKWPVNTMTCTMLWYVK